MQVHMLEQIHDSSWLTWQGNSSPQSKERVQTSALALGHTGTDTAAAQEPKVAFDSRTTLEGSAEWLCTDHLCDTHSTSGVGIKPFFPLSLSPVVLCYQLQMSLFSLGSLKTIFLLDELDVDTETKNHLVFVRLLNLFKMQFHSVHLKAATTTRSSQTSWLKWIIIAL